MGDNERAFQAVRLNPRMGVRFGDVNMKVTVLGEEISMPVIAAPVGSLRNLWPRGEAVAAAAVCKAGTICTLSTLTGTRLEEVKEAAQGTVLVPTVSGGRKRGGVEEHRTGRGERVLGARADDRYSCRWASPSGTNGTAPKRSSAAPGRKRSLISR